MFQIVINGPQGPSVYHLEMLRKSAMRLARQRKQKLLRYYVEMFDNGRVRLVAVIDAGAGTSYTVTEAL